MNIREEIERRRSQKARVFEQKSEATVGDLQEALGHIDRGLGQFREVAQELLQISSRLAGFLEGETSDEGTNLTRLGGVPSVRGEINDSFGNYIGLAKFGYFNAYRDPAFGKKNDAPNTTGIWQVLWLNDEIDIKPSGKGFPGQEPPSNRGFTDEVPGFEDGKLLREIIGAPNLMQNRMGTFLDAVNTVFEVSNRIRQEVNELDSTDPISSEVPGIVNQELIPSWRRMNAWGGSAVWGVITRLDATMEETMERMGIESVFDSKSRDRKKQIRERDLLEQSFKNRPWVQDPAIKEWLPI